MSMYSIYFFYTLKVYKNFNVCTCVELPVPPIKLKEIIVMIKVVRADPTQPITMVSSRLLQCLVMLLWFVIEMGLSCCTPKFALYNKTESCMYCILLPQKYHLRKIQWLIARNCMLFHV